MNATAHHYVMTGNTHPHSGQLTWLSETTSAVSKNIHNVRGQTSSMSLISNPGTIFTTPAAITKSAENKVKMFSPPYQVEKVRHAQTISIPTVSSTGTTLYYSQASRNTSNVLQATHPHSVTFSNSLSTVSQLPDTQQYLQVDSYPSLIGVKTISTSHPQLAYSTAYLQQAKLPSHPTNLSVSDRVFQQGQSILLRQPIEGNLVHITQDKEIKLESDHLSSLLISDSNQKKSFTTSDSLLGSNCSIIIETTSDLAVQGQSVLQEEYKMPTGKEGSLKHRILRPPSISIVDPSPVFVSDAPLSAPPIRTQRDHSPKHIRSLPSSGYRSFSSSASSLPDGSRLVSSCETSPGGNFTNHHSSLSSESHSPAPIEATQLKYPQSFNKGAIIQLANNQLKPVENLTTDDFVECGALSPTLKIDCSTVTSIEKTPATGAVRLSFQVGQQNIQVTVEAPLEHPFFVYKQGWSSCSPERSAQRYGLTCHKLKIGDKCVSITDKPRTTSEPKATNPVVPKANKKSSNCQPTVKTDENKNVDLSLLENTVSATAAVKIELPFSSRKRKRRWSAPDNISPDEEKDDA